MRGKLVKFKWHLYTIYGIRFRKYGLQNTITESAGLADYDWQNRQSTSAADSTQKRAQKLAELDIRSFNDSIRELVT
jgi:hypothetical protein